MSDKTEKRWHCLRSLSLCCLHLYGNRAERSSGQCGTASGRCRSAACICMATAPSDRRDNVALPQVAVALLLASVWQPRRAIVGTMWHCLRSLSLCCLHLYGNRAERSSGQCGTASGRCRSAACICMATAPSDRRDNVALPQVAVALLLASVWQPRRAIVGTMWHCLRSLSLCCLHLYGNRAKRSSGQCGTASGRCRSAACICMATAPSDRRDNVALPQVAVALLLASVW